MQELYVQGKYATAKIFAVDKGIHAIDQYALAQIKMICDNEIAKGSIIRLMPDVHAGKVGPIGLSMDILNNNYRVIPNLIGTDIGCGITVCKIDTKNKKLTDSDFCKLDKIIRENIPSGMGGLFDDPQDEAVDMLNEAILCKSLETPINVERVSRSFGTLGGGNHFIEVDQDDSGNYFIVVHSGSRSLGPVINKYYNEIGRDYTCSKGEDIPYEMMYLEGKHSLEYINDCKFAVKFAECSRARIINTILKGMKWKIKGEPWSSPHNFINEYRLHKGSIQIKFADYSEVFIPINMKDGIIHANVSSIVDMVDWNYSLPHGSGRLYKRSEVADHTTVSEFKKEMKGIYSTSIGKDTLDESPFAYRRIDEIKEALSGVLENIEILHPVYNFKAGGK